MDWSTLNKKFLHNFELYNSNPISKTIYQWMPEKNMQPLIVY